MYSPNRQSQFKKDVKLLIKRGKDMQKLKFIILELLAGRNLDPKHKDHQLIGNYANTRECHVEPDWLLIYRIDQGNKVLHLIRTGSHAELFK